MKINGKDMDWSETRQGDAWFRRKNLGLAAGGRGLGCSLYEIPPGGRDWPYHFHHGNDEAVYVLEGTGVLQTAGTDIPIVAGDYLAMPRGAEHAHRIHNRSEAPLRFLCFSTMHQPDVTEYPETGRLGVFCGAAPGGGSTSRTRSGFYALDGTISYWP